MALHHDLLEQARHLSTREPKRPRQASLRRAISAAYYSIFHLLVSDAATLVAPVRPPALRLQVRRAFGHIDMKTVCNGFASGQVDNLRRSTRQLVKAPIEPGIASVAACFIELYDARHAADYDLALSYTRLDASQKVALAERAFDQWHNVRTEPNAAVFLTALLLQKQWERGSA
jgi:uncharacterized protein (UPF0332 family)